MLWDGREEERIDTTTKYESNKFGYEGEEQQGRYCREPK